jgi:tRNA-dihydrouridine synthase B
MSPVKIGSYKLSSNIMLAPMAGCTDLSFRLISRQHGAKLCFLEMIDANSMVNRKDTDIDIVKTVKTDSPLAGQLVGATPELMLKAAKRLLKLVDIKFLDVNAACPVKKMMKKKAGSYFVKEPENLFKIIKLLSTELALPITVKLRIGFNHVDHSHITDIAKKCEANGASALFVHGRTMKQGYSGEIDYETILKIKESVKVPVFGSGNIFDPIMAKKMLDNTGCDGVMVARGALGNPWIFENIERHLEGKALYMPSIEDRLSALKDHLAYLKKYKIIHPKSQIGFMRKVSLWYVREFEGACKTRGIINSVKSYEELLELIDELPETINRFA